MDHQVIPTSGFIKVLKLISKKHKGILSANLAIQLKENPAMGTEIGPNIYKIRLAISGTNKGKSGGARVITILCPGSQDGFSCRNLFKV